MTIKSTIAAAFAATLVSVASAQIVPPYPSGIETFADPGLPNRTQFAADLGDLYFDSNANVPSSIQGWNAGPVNFTAALGGNPFLAEGGTVTTIFLGETAGWKNDFAYANSSTPTTYTPLVTDVENNLNGTGNIRSGWTTQVSYGAGENLEFYLNSGGSLTQGGLFSAFGSSNFFAGGDTSSHVRWSTRDVTTTYFNGSSWVTNDVTTLLIGFEDTRKGVSFYDGDFNDFVVAFQFLPTQVQAVPEPSTYGLLGGLALVGLVALRRFKRKSA
ncbi:MAG TPA: PEP-CTERM sorting domain-containing protein [Opitutaceae bacterium]|nr:PEP-CTERM sorting domain-containing protein [Opitutaceae bacterium]